MNHISNENSKTSIVDENARYDIQSECNNKYNKQNLYW